MFKYSFLFVRYLTNQFLQGERLAKKKKKIGGRRSIDNLTSDYSLAHVSMLNITSFNVLLCKMPCFTALCLQSELYLGNRLSSELEV